MQQHVWLVGAGGMAKEYVKVLQALHVSFTVIGRGEESAQAFEAATGLPVQRGGLLSGGLQRAPSPTHAIVAVDVDNLAPATDLLMKRGVRSILLEKPGGMDVAELRHLHESALASGTNIDIAYNRRFYASVLKAEELIREDGGVSSFHFEFTEWSHEIQKLPTPAHIKKIWFLGNSSHVLDMAFHMGGFPVEINSCRAGSLPWHPAGAIYTGAGTASSGALFSFYANWDGPGRWSIDISTKQRRFIFKPLETLAVQKRGSVAVEPVALDDQLDKEYKPGLYLMTKDFIFERSGKLCRLEDQVRQAALYSRIAGYE